MNLLVVEDDPMLGKALLNGLVDLGHTCQWRQDGSQGMQLAMNGAWDAIVLDLMLPDIAGLDILQELRFANKRTPVLILSAQGSVEERVRGLQMGADDYLVKPFAFPELIARLEAICRRTSPPPTTTMRVGPLRLDLATHRVSRQEKEIELTPTEFSLIEYLARYQNQVVTRKMLCEHLWDSNWEGATNVIEVHINRLRSKIDRGFDVPLIHTVRGRGYVLKST